MFATLLATLLGLPQGATDAEPDPLRQDLAAIAERPAPDERDRPYEELHGRAFHTAGADTVVSSLWSVDDETTAELMRSFGLGRHQALRAAQLEMLEKNRDEHGSTLPGTWGAFVLSGEWR